VQNALTIDVEEHFQVQNFARVIDPREWDRIPSRVLANTRKVLKILDEYQTQATFFVLGWVADRAPRLVQEIFERGHEIASHGYSHRLVSDMSPEEFASDLERTESAISRAFETEAQSTLEVRLQGYRAPSFSIRSSSRWALGVLAERGYSYDSSLFPPDADNWSSSLSNSRFASPVQGGLWEIPVSSLRVAGRNWPVAGGGYFRLYPFWLTRAAIRRLNSAGNPAVVYLHPWEFDPDQPRVPQATPMSRFRHYVNLEKTERRFRNLLEEFEFGPIREVFSTRL